MNTVREFLGLFFSLLYSQNNGIYNVGVAFVFYHCWSRTCTEHILELRGKEKRQTGRGQRRDKERKKETKKIEEASCT